MKTIDVQTLKPYLEQLPANEILIDVRTVEEFAQGHIPGAENIPLHILPVSLEGLEDYETVYVVCRSGGRSARAAERLEREGKEAVNVEGGTLAWKEAGFGLA